MQGWRGLQQGVLDYGEALMGQERGQNEGWDRFMGGWIGRGDLCCIQILPEHGGVTWDFLDLHQ